MKKTKLLFYILILLGGWSFGQNIPAIVKLPDTSLTATFVKLHNKDFLNTFSTGHSYVQTWDFGDGQTLVLQAPQSNVTHTYSVSGWYKVSQSYAVVDIHGDTVNSAFYTDSVPVGFIHNSGCNAHLVAPDSVMGYSVALIDSSLNDTFNFPVSNFQILSGTALNRSIYYSHGPTPIGNVVYGGGLTHNNFYRELGLQQACLYRQFRDTLGNLICEAYDCKNTYVQSAMTVGCSFVSNPDPLTAGKFFFNATTNASGLNSSVHREWLNWSFGDGKRGQGASAVHYYSKPGNYVVELEYAVVADSSGNVLGVSHCYDTVTVTPTNECGAEFTYEVRATSNSVEFDNMSRCLYQQGGYLEKFQWFFGDGAGSTDKNPLHIYSTPGTYLVKLIQTVEDAQFNIVCSDTVQKAVLVGPGNIICNAYYEVDTVSSGGGNINIVNLSTFAPNSRQQVYYMWDFGDGSQSQLPYPSHSYSTPGLYEVCLNMTVRDSLGYTCTSTFCDSLGMDANGNVLYKNSQVAFTINVVDPNTISIKEQKRADVQVYPNPASGFVNVEGLKDDAKWILTNLQGSVIAEGVLRKKELRIDLDVVTSGLYILNFQESGTIKRIKLSVK